MQATCISTDNSPVTLVPNRDPVTALPLKLRIFLQLQTFTIRTRLSELAKACNENAFVFLLLDFLCICAAATLICRPWSSMMGVGPRGMVSVHLAVRSVTQVLSQILL